MEHEGTISLDLDMETANYIINLMSGRAIVMQGDLGLMLQSQALLLSQERAIGVEKLNAMQLDLSHKITEKWPDTVKYIAKADDPTKMAELTNMLARALDPDPLGRKERGRNCPELGHCACGDGAPCCFCGKILEPGDKRAEGVTPGDQASRSSSVQSNRPLLS